MAAPDRAGVGGSDSLPFPSFFIGDAMRLFELFEAKTEKKTVKAPPPRNFVAKNAQKSGAGSHSDKKYNRKEKHKKSKLSLDESYNHLSTDGKVDILKKWAMDNYNKGADTFVEAWGDEDFASLLDDNNGSVEQSLRFLAKLASVYSEQQADAAYHRSA